MSWSQTALIALGGALGALARYWINSWIQNRLGSTFPWGTFIINVSGAFVIGLALTLLAERVVSHPGLRPFFVVGFLGAYTTFSTFEWETLSLGPTWRALGNAVGSVVAGYAAVRLGVWLAGLIATGNLRA